MNPEAQRIAIAEACGWKMSTETVEHTDGYQWTETRKFWVSPTGKRDALPDYLNDLNAMHSAEKVLLDNGAITSQRRQYDGWLWGITAGRTISATAAQRAEAFLSVLKLHEA